MFVPVDRLTRRILDCYQFHPDRTNYSHVRSLVRYGHAECAVLLMRESEFHRLPVTVQPYVGTYLHPDYPL
jgi:hypothetical protein